MLPFAVYPAMMPCLRLLAAMRREDARFNLADLVRFPHIKDALAEDRQRKQGSGGNQQNLTPFCPVSWLGRW